MAARDDFCRAMVNGNILLAGELRQSLGEFVVAAFDAIARFTVTEKNVELGDAIQRGNAVPGRGDLAFERDANPLAHLRRKVRILDVLTE